METDVKLTKLASCAGCGAKVGAGTLVHMLEGFKTHYDPNLIVGYDKSDDASVYVLNEDLALVQTTDFFPPIVDDPFLYGQIAAANALSDVYAMGGEPKLALNIMCLAEKMDKENRLPATFMVVAPASWDIGEVWDDIVRMRTLNLNQVNSKKQMHVCPLQLDTIERLVNRYSNEGEVVYDPFSGIASTGYQSILMGRKYYGCELNPDYFRDGLGYLRQAEMEQTSPTLFDFFDFQGNEKIARQQII